jgi:hypothetical protein
MILMKALLLRKLYNHPEMPKASLLNLSELFGRIQGCAGKQKRLPNRFVTQIG